MNYQTNHTTGEVVVDEPMTTNTQATALAVYAKGWEAQNNLPIHLAMLKSLGLPRKESLQLLTTYTAATPVSIQKFLNHSINVIGAVVHYHGPYQSRPDAEGRSVEKPGYYHLLLKLDRTEETDVIVGRNVRTVKSNTIIATSANQPCDFFLGMIALEKPYDFDVAIRVAVTGDKEGIFVRLLDDDEEED